MLIGMDIQMIVILALLVLVVMLCVMLSWALRRGGKASRARNRRAQLGESDAEALLERFGFGIVDRQVREKGWIWLDGEAFDFEVRADLLVERDDELYIAEVKTGVMAPDPGYPPTRRQLREYAGLFPDCGLLLVDVESGTVTEICFDDPG